MACIVMTCKEPVDDFWVKDFNECIGLSDRLPATQETKGYDLSPYADELPLCEVGIHSPRRWSFMQLVGAAVLTQSGAKDLDPGMVGERWLVLEHLSRVRCTRTCRCCGMFATAGSAQTTY